MRFLPLLLLIAVLGVAFASPGNAPAVGTQARGDVNCSGTADTVDSLQVLLSAAGLHASTDCLEVAGDVNCDDDVNAADSLDILRFVNDNTQTLDGCTHQVLAARLYAATDSTEAEDTLMRHVYPEMGVGVYTGAGEQVLAGDEIGINDFYLYEFESEFLAGHHVDRQLYGLAMVALFLGDAGVEDGTTGQPFTDSGVLSVLSERVTAAREDDTDFTWRLIDELGLAQDPPLDLADPDLEPETTRLDSVQVFLILYDLILHRPDSVSAAGFPDTETRALHEYAARDLKTSTTPATPTHWRHHADGTAETRTLNLSVTYPNSQVVITSGPLTGFAPAQFLGGLEGFPVRWFPEAGLVPENGKLVNRASTNNTDASGDSRVDFLPNVECPAGQGLENTNVFKALVEVQPQIKSIFPPHEVLGLMTIFAETEIEVSRHGGTGAQATGGGVAIEAITDLNDLPCQWTGTGHGSIHHYVNNFADEVGTIDVTFTFGNLQIFENFNTATYEVIGGSATWHAEGDIGNGCSWSEGGTEELQGGLTIGPGTSGSLEYGGTVATKGQNRQIDCAGDSTIIIETVQVLIGCSTGGPWIVTGLDLTGSCDSDSPQSWHDEFNWHLTSGGCPGPAAVTPQGTCGGAAATRP